MDDCDGEALVLVSRSMVERPHDHQDGVPSSVPVASRSAVRLLFGSPDVRFDI